MTEEIAIKASNIGVTFKVDGGQIEAVRNVSFTLHKGQTIALVGESGSGKSVTARAIMRLLSKRARVSDDTEILYGGRNMARLSDRDMRGLRGNRLTMIFQEPMSSLNPVYTIGTQIAEVLRIHQKISKAAAMKRAKDFNPTSIRDQLATTKDVVAVTGKLTLDQNRNPVKPAVVVKVTDTGETFEAEIAP